MRKALFAWIGMQDLRSAEDNGAKGLGAICQAATSRQYDEIIMLSDYPTEKSASYIEWLKNRGVNTTQLIPIDLDGNPTDFRAIYEGAKRSVQNYLQQSKPKVELTFHLSPGTPAMATIWVILANSVFQAKLIQSSPERGVQDVDFPFDIAADYLPDLLKHNEKKISAMFADRRSESAEFKAIIHQSNVMKKLVERAKTIAPYPVPVLIQGESGTGKELLAKAIHTASLRKGKFLAINCGAIPVELFESELFGYKKGAFTGAEKDKSGYIEDAAGGTLFLDEIGEMPLRIQVKLLRVIQEGTFTRIGESSERKADIRIISATNRNLVDEIILGTFREDLFHRLAVAILYVPPLREREGDIGVLIDHLLVSANRKLQINSNFKERKMSVAAKSCLLKHSWPGNVRELQNTLMRAAVWSHHEVIDLQAIEDAMLQMPQKKSCTNDILNRPIQDGFDLEEIIGEVARHYLERAMKETGGNKSKAAKKLNFKSYQRLDIWLQKYGI
jgi:transcriptional regulator with PAS, ATPase and Fis domain